jgi:hypothetical protein
MCADALVVHDVTMHPELSSSVAQIRFRDLSSRFSRRSRVSVASDPALPPPRERDPVGRDRHLV